MRQIAALEDVVRQAEQGGRSLSVCIVTSEILGPIKNGGIATATSALLDQLVADGAAVTVLSTMVEQGKPTVTERSWDYWVSNMATRGVRLTHIPHFGVYRDWRQKSWLVMQFLKGGTFDIVYFNDHHGSGYYSFAASRAGLAPFSEQLLCLVTHGSMEWVYETNDEYIRRAADIEMMAMERRSVEWADVVLAPSRYLAGKYEEYGWTLPERTYHQPYAILRAAVPQPSPERKPVDELVYFGRLETRKGLWVFCDALDRLGDRLKGKTVTFMGRMTEYLGQSTGALVLARSARWPCKVRLLTDYDQIDAVNYIRSGNRLAVMPSLADNSPCVVYECIMGEMPFLTGSGSGADELVAQEDAHEVLVEPAAEPLAEKLVDILERGAVPARPKFDPAEVIATWTAWHRAVAADPTAFKANPPVDLDPAQVLESTVPLVFIADCARQPFSVVAATLRTNLERLGNRARYLIFSSRELALRSRLADLASAMATKYRADIYVFGPPDIVEVREFIEAADCAIFTGAGHEIELAFFLHSTALLMSGQAAAVSSVTATRVIGGEAPVILDLPYGDAPGTTVLGQKIGSALWAIKPDLLTDELSLLQLLDDKTGDTTPSEIAGQRMLELCISNDKTVLLLPLMGSVEVVTSRTLPRQTRSYDDAKVTARTFGITPSIAVSGPSWLGVAYFGTHQMPPANELELDRITLSEGHPVRAEGFPLETLGAPAIAAAFDRPAQALQMAADAGLNAVQVGELLSLSVSTARSRSRRDLIGTLVDLAESEGPTLLSSPGLIGWTDERLENFVLLKNVAPLNARSPGTLSVRAADAELCLFGLPLAGHQKLSCVLRQGASDAAIDASLQLLDEATGVLIGRADAIRDSDGTMRASIALHGIYSTASLILSLDGAALGASPHTQLTVKEISIA